MGPKAAARAVYDAAIGAWTLAALPFRKRDRAVAVFYGGARGGDIGGPLVKLSLLARRFPERRIGFSLIYLLSNALHLPPRVFKAVRNVHVPIVLNQNGVYYRGWFREWERANARMANAHASADYVLYQSEFCERCAKRFLGSPGGAHEILYNAVDTQRFHPAVSPPTSRSFAFLLTGKIGPTTAYRLTSSIEGLAEARRGGLDVRLIVAGWVDRSVMRKAEDLIERAKVAMAIDFLGPYTSAQAPAIYQSADAYLITKHNDPCPNAVLEAMACGLPVLYSATGGIPELVGQDAGSALVVAESFDETLAPAPKAIADGMAKIMAARRRMGQAARVRAVERFELATWLDRHQALFDRLVRRI